MTFEELLEASAALESANGDVKEAARALGIGVEMAQLNIRVTTGELEMWRAAAGKNLSKWIRERLNGCAGRVGEREEPAKKISRGAVVDNEPEVKPAPAVDAGLLTPQYRDPKKKRL